MLGSMILTLNNINFYQELMFEIRKNIKKGTFSKFYNKYSRKL
jgi:queuine tRNA-ribosyltransferase